MKNKTLTNYDLLKLEAKAAQAKIDAIKKILSCDKQSTRVPVVIQNNK